MIHKYGNHTFHAVYGEVDEELKKEIVAFWTKNQAIADPREAQRGTREVVFVIRNADGEIAGISSVYTSNLPDGRKYFFYRMFIQPPDRKFGMMRAVTIATKDFLRDLPMLDKPLGVIFVMENRKLMRRSVRRMFIVGGAVCMGTTPDGCEVWKIDFPAAPAKVLL